LAQVGGQSTFKAKPSRLLTTYLHRQAKNNSVFAGTFVGRFYFDPRPISDAAPPTTSKNNSIKGAISLGLCST